MPGLFPVNDDNDQEEQDEDYTSEEEEEEGTGVDVQPVIFAPAFGDQEGEGTQARADMSIGHIFSE